MQTSILLGPGDLSAKADDSLAHQDLSGDVRPDIAPPRRRALCLSARMTRSYGHCGMTIHPFGAILVLPMTASAP